MKRNLILFIITIIFSVILFKSNITAQWGPIDDHEIYRFLGTDLRLQLNEIIPTLLHATEVGNYGKQKRYRPAYFFIRITECWAWGNRASYWYISHLAIYILSAFLLWKMFDRYIGLVLSGFFTLILITVPGQSVADIFTRLGPAETYAYFGLSLYLFSISRIISGNIGGSKIGWWVLVFFSSLITIGVKENFFFIAPLSLIFFCFEIYKTKKFYLSVLITNIFIIIFAAFIFGSIYLGLSLDNSDIYSNRIDQKNIFKHLINNFSYIKIIPLSVSILLYTLSYILYRLYKNSFVDNISYIIANIIIIQVILIGLSLSQYVFYSGNIYGRYMFPFSWFQTISYIIIVYSLIIFANNIIYIKHVNRHKIVINILLFFICFAAYKVFFFDNFEKIRVFAADNKVITAMFSITIDKLVSELDKNKGVPVVIETNNFTDLEPVHAIIIFLKTYKVDNLIAVRNNLDKNQIKNSWYLKLNDMADKLEQGHFFMQSRITPFDQSLVQDKHYIINFRKTLLTYSYQSGSS